VICLISSPGKTAWKAKGSYELVESGGVTSVRWVEGRNRAFDPQTGENGRRSMTRTDDENKVKPRGLDDSGDMGIDQDESWASTPVAQKARLDVVFG
jgi:hypothetical protein